MQQSLGKVTVASAGTPVRATANQTTPANRFPAHSYLVEAVVGNTGKVYIGAAGMDKSTLVGVFVVLPPPTANVLPSFSATVSYSPNHFNMADVWIDVDTNNEGALVSCITA